MRYIYFDSYPHKILEHVFIEDLGAIFGSVSGV